MYYRPCQESLSPINFVDRIFSHVRFYIMAASHGQQVANGHGIKIFTGFSWQLIWEETHHFICKVQFPLTNGQSNGSGGKRLTDRMHQMRLFG